MLTESALQAEKTQLESLLTDVTVSSQSKALAQRSINELNTAINVIQRSPALQDAAELGFVLSDFLALGSLAAGKALTSTIVREFVLAKTGKEIAGDAATRISLNFYKDAGVDLGPAMYRSAAETSTHNAQAGEVILGRYIAGSPASYEQVAISRGATYFEMGDWSKTSSMLGADNMWNVNRAFLDQQITQGKSFVFTADPTFAPPLSFTGKELSHLLNSGYKIVEEAGGMFRAIKK